jgi:L-iditol 2-dehydrogenase
MMKRAEIVGERQAVLVDAPDPKPVADWALVKVHAAPLCTDYKAWIAGQRVEFMGHEAAGEVVAVAQPCAVSVGDRVVVMPLYPCGACALCEAGDYIHCVSGPDFEAFTGGREGRATVAQYLLKPSWILLPIPDDVSYELASLALCSLGPSYGALQRMDAKPGETLLITGAGPVGQGAVANALFRGMRAIVAEPVAERRAIAQNLGAAATVNPDDSDVVEQIRNLTGGPGVDCALDCAGYVPAERLCIDATRRRGRVAFVGECGDALPICVSNDLIRKGLTIIGSWHYNRNDYAGVMRVVRESPLVSKLISRVMPMSAIQDALELSAAHGCGKIVLDPWR